MGVVTKRSSMLFYSDGTSQYSHRVRIVLAEKGVAVDILDCLEANKPAELADINNRGSSRCQLHTQVAASRPA